MNPKIWGILVLMVLLWILLAILSPESFLQANNIENLLRRTAMHGLLGIAVAFVIITGGIDLSVGSMVGLTGCLFALLLQVTYQPTESWRVARIDSSAQVVEIEGTSHPPQVGDSLRYYGGRRAEATLFTLQSVETSDIGLAKGHVRLLGSQGLSRDDTTGLVARVYPIHSSVTEPAGTLVIAARLNSLTARDRLVLLEKGGSIQERTIDQIEFVGETTMVRCATKPERLEEIDGVIPLRHHSVMSLPWALLAVLSLGVAIGITHGTLVTKLGIQPFVVTLCGLLIYRGVARWLVSDRTMGFGTDYANTLGRLASGRWILWSGADGVSFGIPYVAFLLAVVAICAAIFLNRTIWGRYIFALGRNREAARYAGIHVDRMTIVAYVLCSTLTVIGAIAFAADSNSIAPSSFGNFFELYAIAAAVLGGCSLRGGEGSILGVVIGTALMQTLYNLIVLLKISDKLEFAVIGGVILAGVIVDEIIRRWASNRLVRADQAPK